MGDVGNGFGKEINLELCLRKRIASHGSRPFGLVGFSLEEVSSGDLASSGTAGRDVQPPLFASPCATSQLRAARIKETDIIRGSILIDVIVKKDYKNDSRWVSYFKEGLMNYDAIDGFDGDGDDDDGGEGY